MFSSGADFGRINSSVPIFVSAVNQKALIEVNEVGTEAAAATTLTFSFRTVTPMFKVGFVKIVLWGLFFN